MASTLMRNYALQASMAILIATSMTACNGKDEMRWKEEVRLHDDKAILIDRNSIRIKSGFPNSRRGPIIQQEIKYAPLDFFWSTPATEQPLSFDLIDGSAYFVTIPAINRANFCLGKVKGTYQANFYLWQNDNLIGISQHEAPIDSLRKNISGLPKWTSSTKNDPTYLSMEDVNDSNGVSRDDPPPTLRKFFEEQQKHYLVCP